MYARRNRPSTYSYSATSGRWKTRGLAGRSRGGWRPQRNYNATANAKASRALQLIRKFKNEEEKKIINTTLSFSRATTVLTGQFASVNLCTQGNTKTTRIGNKVTMEGLAIRARIALDPDETQPVSLRFMVVMDRRPAGAVFAGTDLLTVDTVLGLYNTEEENQGRFQVLLEKNIVLSPNGTENRFLKLYIPLKGIKASYNGNAGTVADLQKNHIAIGFWSYGNTQTSVMNGYARLRFTDA